VRRQYGPGIHPVIRPLKPTFLALRDNELRNLRKDAPGYPQAASTVSRG
jgi:hypothetical protein